MNLRRFVCLLGVVVVFGACIPSVNPFYTARDVVFDARLVGEWKSSDKEGPQVWKFEKGDDSAYKLSVTEKDGKRGDLRAHLFKLKNEHFLDLIPDGCDYATNQADVVSAAMFPGHLVFRVTQFEPVLKLAMTDFDWLEKYLEKNPKALAHRMEDKGALLTADTPELQRFILAHLGPGELFGEPTELSRK